MKIQFLTFICLVFAWGANVQAASAADVNSDTEDIMNESDAAVAETKDFKDRTAQEKAAAEKRRDAAKSQLNNAAAKRQKAIDEMNATEDEIKHLGSEQSKTKADAARLDNENAQTEKTTKDNQAKIEKMKADLVVLKQQRTEKAQKYLELAGQRDKVNEQLKALETEKQTAEAELKAANDQDRATTDQVVKLRKEYAAKKAKGDAYLAELREKYKRAVDHQAQLGVEKSEMEKNDLKQQATIKTAEQEVAQAENPSQQLAATEPSADTPTAAAQPAATSTPSAAKAAEPSSTVAAREPSKAKQDVTFKHKCRVFDGPVRGSNVVGVQESGMSVSKFDEGKEWIAFWLRDGRKAFAAKNCFK